MYVGSACLWGSIWNTLLWEIDSSHNFEVYIKLMLKSLNQYCGKLMACDMLSSFVKHGKKCQPHMVCTEFISIIT